MTTNNVEVVFIRERENLEREKKGEGGGGFALDVSFMHTMLSGEIQPWLPEHAMNKHNDSIVRDMPNLDN